MEQSASKGGPSISSHIPNKSGHTGQCDSQQDDNNGASELLGIQRHAGKLTEHGSSSHPLCDIPVRGTMQVNYRSPAPTMSSSRTQCQCAG